MLSPRRSNRKELAGNGVTMSSTVVLNVFPATFSANSIAAFAGPYVDDTSFALLLADALDWTAWRDTRDGSRVYAWRHSGDVTFERVGFRPVTVTTGENAEFACRVMLDGIDRHLRAVGFTRVGGLRGGYANWSLGNLFDRVLGDRLGRDARVGVYPRIVVDSFVTSGLSPDEPFIGLIVDVDTVNRLDVPVDEVIAGGFELRGRYVKLARVTGSGPTGHEGLLVGRIREVQGTTLVLDDVRDRSYEEIEAVRCVLDPNRWTMEAYLKHRLGREFDDLRALLDTEYLRMISPGEHLRLSREFVRRRLVVPGGGPLPIAAGLTVSFGEAAAPAPGASPFSSRELLAPIYSFDPESPKTHPKATEGLRTYGPYGAARLRGTNPSILVLAPNTHKGQVQQFLAAFRDGIGDRRVYEGFRKKFRLDGLEVVERYFEWRSGPPKDAYYNATVAALEERSDYSVAFVVIRDDFKQLPPRDDPYCVCKTLLLSFAIVVQELRLETLRLPEHSLRWVLQNVALATYAKLGGVPFVLRARQLTQPELIFGIGRTVERPPGSRLSPMQQVIGFTAVFRSDGDYLLNSCTPYTDFAHYERHLEELILKVVPEVAASEGVPDDGSMRLIFHLYRSAGRREVAAIENAIAKLPRYGIEYALLHVNDSHDVRLYDQADDRLIPPRRLVVELGPRERLIVLIGPEQYRGRGTNAPLRLTLHRASTFRDLDYLTQQLYEFAGISWRTFNLATQPVTIRYSELMAQLNSKLREVAPWNQEIVRTKLRRKLWFL